MKADRFPVEPGGSDQEEMGEEAQHRSQARGIPEALADLEDAPEIPFEIEIPLQVGTAQRQLVERPAERPPRAEDGPESRLPRTEAEDLSRGENDLAGDAGALQETGQTLTLPVPSPLPPRERGDRIRDGNRSNWRRGAFAQERGGHAFSSRASAVFSPSPRAGGGWSAFSPRSRRVFSPPPRGGRGWG